MWANRVADAATKLALVLAQEIGAACELGDTLLMRELRRQDYLEAPPG